MAAAASSLRSQSQDLVQAVAVFKLSANEGQSFQQAPALRTAPLAAPAAMRTLQKQFSAPPKRKALSQPTAKPSSKPAAAIKPALPKPAPAAKAATDDWETF
jgi:methyl-accepting chemotaxis protein-1 (serine sensor receptor)